LEDKKWALEKCLESPSLELRNVWEKIKKIDPKNPVKCQLWLGYQILKAIPKEDDHYTTMNEANIWKRDVQKSLQELIQLMDKRPANLRAFDKYSGKNLQEHIVPNSLINQKPEFEKLARRIRLSTSYSMSYIFQCFLDAIDSHDLKYNPGSFGKWVSGDKAVRQCFVRRLSKAFKVGTGQWKRKNVAVLTSTIFDCNYTEPQVIRATKDITQNWKDLGESGIELVSPFPPPWPY
jgi:hypothetical protein